MDRRRRIITGSLGAALVLLGAAFSGCTSILGDFEIDAVSLEAGSGRPNGEVCGAGTECGSGFCSDGVCCDTACTGTCESCAAPLKGTCSPVPAGTDPQLECAPTARPDAGNGVVVGDASSDDAAADAGNTSGDAGAVINVPDGGTLASDDTPCAGSCDGNRACKFPGREKVCGTQFCNTSDQQAAFSCDTKGRCELALTSCGSSACVGTTCKTTCAVSAECAESSFCNQTGTCQEKLGNGTLCSISGQCKSGNCIDGICCNSDCNRIPGGTCKQAGSEGVCRCGNPVLCGPCAACTQGCQPLFVDKDGDGHAAPGAAAPTPPTPQLGCVENRPPAGTSPLRDDCNDDDPRVFPGQTEFFALPTATGSHDFDCDGETIPETPVYPGGKCQFCPGVPPFSRPFCPAPEPTCEVGGQQANLDCRLSQTTKGYTCAGPGGNAYEAGFVEKVGCGESAQFVNCATCREKGGAPGRPNVDPSRVQRCR